MKPKVEYLVQYLLGDVWYQHTLRTTKQEAIAEFRWLKRSTIGQQRRILRREITETVVEKSK